MSQMFPHDSRLVEGLKLVSIGERGKVVAQITDLLDPLWSFIGVHPQMFYEHPRTIEGPLIHTTRSER